MFRSYPTVFFSGILKLVVCVQTVLMLNCPVSGMNIDENPFNSYRNDWLSGVQSYKYRFERHATR